MKVTKQDFAVAKKAIKGIADTSRAHLIAIETLTQRCPGVSENLIQDAAWQVVMAAR
jgi:hypothetical protein